MDVIEDLAGNVAVAFIAEATEFDNGSMTFEEPSLIEGNETIYNCQFAAGWSSIDHDGDTSGTGNCAINYSNVSQHYCACWSYNLGSDADSPLNDGDLGPHVNSARLSELELEGDGTTYSRVRRISRFVQW